MSVRAFFRVRVNLELGNNDDDYCYADRRKAQRARFGNLFVHVLGPVVPGTNRSDFIRLSRRRHN